MCLERVITQLPHPLLSIYDRPNIGELVVQYY